MDNGQRGPLAASRLLLIEDAAALRQLLRHLLELEGATVDEAGTGREALELVRRQPFDLVLTDLGLPDMPGRAVVARVCAVLQGRTPVAVLSGAGQDELRGALEAGAERVFAKPVDWDDLLAYVVERTVSRVA
jgi:CheY-like chemotaxis protein